MTWSNQDKCVSMNQIFIIVKISRVRIRLTASRLRVVALREVVCSSFP